MKYVIGLVIFLYTLVFTAVLYAACTGCGEGGHGAFVKKVLTTAMIQFKTMTT